MNWALSIPAILSPANVSKTTVSGGEAYVRDPGRCLVAERVHPLRMGTFEKGTLGLGSSQRDSDRFPGGLEVVIT